MVLKYYQYHAVFYFSMGEGGGGGLEGRELITHFNGDSFFVGGRGTITALQI